MAKDGDTLQVWNQAAGTWSTYTYLGGWLDNDGNPADPATMADALIGYKPAAVTTTGTTSTDTTTIADAVAAALTAVGLTGTKEPTAPAKAGPDVLTLATIAILAIMLLKK